MGGRGAGGEEARKLTVMTPFSCGMVLNSGSSLTCKYARAVTPGPCVRVLVKIQADNPRCGGGGSSWRRQAQLEDLEKAAQGLKDVATAGGRVGEEGRGGRDLGNGVTAPAIRAAFAPLEACGLDVAIVGLAQSGRHKAVRAIPVALLRAPTPQLLSVAFSLHGPPSARRQASSSLWSAADSAKQSASSRAPPARARAPMSRCVALPSGAGQSAVARDCCKRKTRDGGGGRGGRQMATSEHSSLPSMVLRQYLLSLVKGSPPTSTPLFRNLPTRKKAAPCRIPQAVSTYTHPSRPLHVPFPCGILPFACSHFRRFHFHAS